MSRWNKTYFKSVYGIIRTIMILPRMTLIIPYGEKNGTLVVSRTRLYLTYLFSIINIITTGFVLAKQVDFAKLQSNPYYLLGFLRILIYYHFVFISTLHVNTKHVKIVGLINRMKQWETEVKLSVTHLRIITWITILELFYGYSIWSIRFFLSIHDADDRTFSYYFGKVFDTFVKLLPEVNQFIFLDFVITYSFFVREIHKKLEKMSERVNGQYFLFSETRDSLTWEKISEIRLFYGEIHDSKELVDDIYSVHNLLTIGYILIELVFIIFLNITISNLWEPYGEKVSVIKFQQILLILTTNTIKLYVIASFCRLLSTTMKKTGILVHRLFQNTRDVELRSEVISKLAL